MRASKREGARAKKMLISNAKHKHKNRIFSIISLRISVTAPVNSGPGDFQVLIAIFTNRFSVGEHERI
jgi:hypothetical protein